jgi:hypothetical protein
MADVRRIVIDVLKPHEPSLLQFTQDVSAAEGVEAVTTSLVELDSEVQNIKITAEGEALEYSRLEAAVTDAGGTVHSVDQVSCGSYVVQEQRTLQDR